MKHNRCADLLILKADNPADFAALETAWFRACSPTEEAEKHLVQEVVHAD